MDVKYQADAATTQYVNVGDLRLAYRVIGPGDALPFVLAMRFRGVMDEWDPKFLDALATRRRVYFFDSSGVGLSSGTVPDNIPDMGRILIDFAQALDLGTFDLLGWSMGGYVAQSAALQRPDLVRRLVVAGSGPGGVPNAPAAPDKVWEAAFKPVNSQEDFLYLFFPETTEGHAAGRDHLARLWKRTEEAVPSVKQAGVKQMIVAFEHLRQRDAMYPLLERLTLPVLYANGVDDVMIHAFNSYAAACKVPNGQLILYPHAGHGSLFQHREWFVGDVLKFMDSV